MLRAILILHRYLGALVGLLMTLWCLSGFVMMYQSFPEVEPAERVAGLEALDLAGGLDLSAVPLSEDEPVAEARLEMVAGRPVLRLNVVGEGRLRYDVAAKAWIDGFTEAEMLKIAAAYGRGHGFGGKPQAAGEVDLDQWTIQTATRNRPVHRFDFDGKGAGQVYVSAASGEVFQATDRRERLLSWLGAIPHWLYPTLLRQNVALWSQVVIWGSILGVFLTATGLYVGILKMGKGRGGAVSPYKGLWFWHHMTGLIFGVLTLTWVFSGLLTMNPWGFLESGAGELRGHIAGTARWDETRQALLRAPVRPGTVELTVQPLGGKAFVLASGVDGAMMRFNPSGLAAPTAETEITAALAAGHVKTAKLEKITAEDAYFYGHHGEAPLPAWRAILAGPDQTRVYIEAATGRVAMIADPARRSSRWLQSALHDFDWPVIRKRPIWDLVVLPLLAGVTVSCAIGAWMGLTRIGKDIRFLRTLIRRRKRLGQVSDRNAKA